MQDAADRTYREVTELEDQGFDHQDAWEIVRERYLFPPEEGKKPTAYSDSYIGKGLLSIDIPPPPSVSRQIIMDDKPRVNVLFSESSGSRPKTTGQVDPAIERKRDEPRVNILSGVPLQTQSVRHYSERRGLILLLIWMVISVPLVDLGWIGVVAAVFTAGLLIYIEHMQRERDREVREREAAFLCPPGCSPQ